MAYHTEKTSNGQDIVIDGFEMGIADSPHLGIGDMKNINIISIPKEGSVNFATVAMNQPPVVSAVAFTVAAATDAFTVTSTAGFYDGMAFTLNTLVNGTGLATGRVYWMGNITATTFKAYKSPSVDIANLVNVTLDGSGTYSTYTLGSIIDKTIDYSGGNNLVFGPKHNYQFFLDSNGLVWWVYNKGGTLTNNLVYLGNTTTTATTGRAISMFRGYIIVFRSGPLDAVRTQGIENNASVDFSGTWHYAWDNVSTVNQTPRPTVWGLDDVLYFGNSKRLGSLIEVAGMSFDPTNGATYTLNQTALALPIGDDVNALGQLGQNLLIGGLENYVYPWDRISVNFLYPLILSENLTSRIVTANNTAYIFAGNRGRIYVSNGSNVDLFKKIPDSITTTIDPYFTWGDAYYWKNQLYFSFNATTNAGVDLANSSGVYAIDLSNSNRAFRMVNKLSYGSYAGMTTVIVPNVLSNTPGGAGLYIGWNNSGVFGLDTTSSTPYTGGQSIIDSDIISVGQFLTQKTFQNVEFKLSTPLVAGESVVISQRSDITTLFTTIAITEGGNTGDLSGIGTVDFQNVQWIQLRASLTSTASSPSYVRLEQLRIR